MGVLKSRDFINFHYVLFSSLCKSPELFMFIGYASKLWRSLWYLMWLPFTRLTLLMNRLCREASQSQIETCSNVSTSSEGRMALIDRRGCIRMNFRVTFHLTRIYVFKTSFLFCILIDTYGHWIVKINCVVSIACNISLWLVQRKIFASKMRTCDFTKYSVPLSVLPVR